MKTFECPSDGQVNEVKVSIGKNKPENKGREYISCLKCSEFYWIENGEAVSPRTGTLRVDQSQYEKPDSPFKKPVTETNGYKKFEEVGNKIKGEVEAPDWDIINIRKNASFMSNAYRSQGQSPREAMELGHFWEWMDLVCFDLKGYDEWKREAIDRIYANEPSEAKGPKSAKETPKLESDEEIEEFLNQEV